MTKNQRLTEQEEARQQKTAEASQIMGRLGLIVERSRIFGRWTIRIRRKTDMFPVWTKKGINADTILTEMLRWLHNQDEKSKSSTPNPAQ